MSGVVDQLGPLSQVGEGFDRGWSSSLRERINSLMCEVEHAASASLVMGLEDFPLVFLPVVECVASCPVVPIPVWLWVQEPLNEARFEPC